MAFAYDEISREGARSIGIEAKKELEIFSALHALEHEHERIRDFLGAIEAELEPFLVPEKPNPVPTGREGQGDSSQIVVLAARLRDQAEDVAEHLHRLRARIR